MVKISIIIPVFNVEKYLAECLDSVINQTESNIEIICVEDCSTDESGIILAEYEKKDPRLRIVWHEKNQGLCKTRKDGVIEAKGEYIMFLDSDDYIEKDACKNLYKKIREFDVDVFQANSYVDAEEGVSNEIADYAKSFMLPREGFISGKDLLSSWLVDKKINCNLWNKIYRSNICKKAFSMIEDDYQVTAEDWYTTFIILYYSSCAYGYPDIYFYHYRLGVGVTGGDQLSIDQFKKRCSGAKIIKKIDRFLKKVGQEEVLKKEKDILEMIIRMDCVDCWIKKLDRNKSDDGMNVLREYWSEKEIKEILDMDYYKGWL